MEGEAEAGQGDGAGDRRLVGDEGHVHGPVGARHFAVLAGAVERIDDPDAFGVEPGEIVLALLAEHRVVRALFGQTAHQQLVGLTVALGLQDGGRGVFGAEASTEFEQEVARFGGELGGELMIVESHGSNGTGVPVAPPEPIGRFATVSKTDTTRPAREPIGSLSISGWGFGAPSGASGEIRRRW